MEFVSAQQTAERLGVTVRAVQKWAKEGKIPGARQMGRSWLIPDHFTGPAEPAGKTAFSLSSHIPMPLLNASFEPGGAREYIETITDETDRTVAMAEYDYFTGRTDSAAKAVEPLLAHPDFNVASSACCIYFLANRAMGKAHLAYYALECSRALIAETLRKTQDPHTVAVAVYHQVYSAIMLQLPVKPAAPLEQMMRCLPEGMRMFAAYMLAYKAHLEHDDSRSLGIADTALAFASKPYPVAKSALMLMCTIDLISLKRVEEARHCFMTAYHKARPDDLIELFGEHHALLQGITESCLRHDYPEDFRRLNDITLLYNQGRRKMNRVNSGQDLAAALTPLEFSIATLINHGWSIREIAGHLDLSDRMIKHYISVIYQKLGVTNREELRLYISQ